MDILQSLYCNKQTQCAAYLINRLWLVPFPPQRVSGSAVISANFFDLTETQTAKRIVLFPDKFILDSVFYTRYTLHGHRKTVLSLLAFLRLMRKKWDDPHVTVKENGGT